MFDTITVKQSPAYPQTIHEHRAPTDESVKLLAEMEQKALDRLLAKGNLEGNTESTDERASVAVEASQLPKKSVLPNNSFDREEEFLRNELERHTRLMAKTYPERTMHGVLRLLKELDEHRKSKETR